MIHTYVPIRTISEANSRGHWSTRAKRVKAQRDAVGWFLSHHRGARSQSGSLTVELERLAPRALDTDNLAGALKAVRDEVARFLGRDDGPNAGISWVYRQKKSGIYGVQIIIRKAEEHGTREAVG